MKNNIIISLFLVFATHPIYGQKKYINDIFLTDKKKYSLPVNICKFWYFSDAFNQDTFLCNSAKSAIGYTGSKQLSISPTFTGYIDIQYDSYTHTNEVYNKFIKLFTEKKIDLDKSIDGFIYSDMFKICGLSICIHKEKPIIRLYRYTGVYNKNFFNQFLPILNKQIEWAKIFYIPGGQIGSKGSYEIIPKNVKKKAIRKK